LFPKLNKSKNTKYHSKVSLWFGKYISAELGINRANLKPFHAFRHTFITICRVKNVRIDVQKSVIGHSQGDVASQYGSYGLDLKNEVVQQIPRCFEF
jgi:integrase